ncbi:hypothetical protein FA95DRAFT_714340 [Auriscalpium vulgare]|uniref:Uncharacterized protein n=1 Tax=Auriscalpium vulgare TaxID=40419 RepID=A0ACB8RBM9_9AGAM|nr:hypothetical protein FA95DRAFT_714340 [Auriscalpium vulgare]
MGSSHLVAVQSIIAYQRAARAPVFRRASGVPLISQGTVDPAIYICTVDVLLEKTGQFLSSYTACQLGALRKRRSIERLINSRHTRVGSKVENGKWTSFEMVVLQRRGSRPISPFKIQSCRRVVRIWLRSARNNDGSPSINRYARALICVHACRNCEAYLYWDRHQMAPCPCGSEKRCSLSYRYPSPAVHTVMRRTTVFCAKVSHGD